MKKEFNKENKTKEVFNKLVDGVNQIIDSGEYAKFFGELVRFTPLFINRQEDVEAPPPVFYFLPFYINQDIGL